MLYLFMKTTKKNSKTASPGKVFALIVLAIIIASLSYGWHRVVSAQSGNKLDLQPEIVTFTQFPLPNPSPAAQPFGILRYITDHAMWFTEKATGKLGRIAPDGTLTVTLGANGGRTVTALKLESTGPGTWDTDPSSDFWALGVATALDAPLINNPATKTVNFTVPDGGTFVLFAADYTGIEFVPGAAFTLTATYSDGTIATSVGRVP